MPRSESLQRLVKKYFPNNFREAEKIITCESNWNPEAIGDSGNSIGLFQINKVHFKRFNKNKLLEPEYNIWVASVLFKEQKWNPWTCRKVL